jgi:hypothetical protein
MPRIPTYEKRGTLPTSYQQGLDARDRDAFTLGARGTIQAGKDVQEAAGTAFKWWDQNQRETATLDMAVASAGAKQQFLEQFEQLSNQEEQNVDFYKGLSLNEADGKTLVNQTRAMVARILSKNDTSKPGSNKYFDNEYEKFSADFTTFALGRAIETESRFRVQAAESALSNGLEKSAVSVSVDPSLLDSTMTMWRMALGDLPPDKIPPGYSQKNLAPLGVKPEGLDKYIGVVRPGTAQKARENLNKIAEVAFMRMIADDPKSAHAALRSLTETPEGKFKLEKLYGFTGDQYARLLNSSKTSKDTVLGYEKFKVETAIEDSVASIRSTGVGLPQFKDKDSLRAAIAAVTDQTDPRDVDRSKILVDKAWSEITVAKKVHSHTQGLANMKTADIAAYVKNIKVSGENAADEARIRNEVATVANGILEQRSRDQVAYWMQNPAVQQQAKNGNVGEARNSVLALQMKDGVPQHELKVLSQAEVENEKSYLLGASPQDLGIRLRSMSERYAGKDGKYMGQLQIVFRQLQTGPNPLPPEYFWAMQAMGTAAEPKIINALTSNTKTLRENLGNLKSSGTSYADLEATSIRIGEQYRRALTGNLPQRLEFFDSMRNLAVRMTATELVNKGGGNPQDLLKKNFAILSEGYDIDGGTYVIPKPRVGTTAQEVYSPKVVHTNADRLRKDPKLLGQYVQIQTPGSFNPALAKQPEYRHEQYLGTIAKQGYWINMGDGGAIQLVVEVNGVVEPVIDKQGKQVFFTFKQLSNPNLLPQKNVPIDMFPTQNSFP